MIYILSYTTRKHQKTLSRTLHLKLKKIQRLSRKNGIQGLFKNVRTLPITIPETMAGDAFRLQFPSRSKVVNY